MPSTMNTILEFVSAELEQFDFAVVTGGAFFDAAHKLPSCLIVPRCEKTEPHGPLSDRTRYLVELQMQFAGHDRDDLTGAALEKTESIVAHFSHRLSPTLSGHIDTAAEILEPVGAGKDGNCDLAAPSVMLTFTVLQQT
jgi:hypothetical protein